jgi:ferritin
MGYGKVKNKKGVTLMKERVAEALTKQVNKEFYSAYLYLGMSAYFQEKNLSGFANYMRVQAQEEMTHAMKIFDFLIERGEKPSLDKIDGIKADWKDVVEIFDASLKHERMITDSINNILEIAFDEKDYATANMLQWFVSEQVEEESNVENILEQLKMIEGKGPGLFMLDRELQSRVFVDATKNA